MPAELENGPRGKGRASQLLLSDEVYLAWRKQQLADSKEFLDSYGRVIPFTRWIIKQVNENLHRRKKTDPSVEVPRTAEVLKKETARLAQDRLIERGRKE